jgi:NAD(P)-dependent dehydrogenase (short-subunit alcohol dehydrogenase family)
VDRGHGSADHGHRSAGRGHRSTGVAVITGTTHGIGRVTACELAKAGLTLVMLNRDMKAGNAVRDEIGAVAPGTPIHVLPCDLASLASVRECARAVRREFDSIGLLINNAGMVSARHRMSADGFELTFATNHLGPFLLTQLLLDRMGAGSRIINVASRAHYRGSLDLERIRAPRARYSATGAYAQSKLANVLHAFALARRLADRPLSAGRPVTANCLHPGIVATNLLPRWLRIVKPLVTRVTFGPERGARTTLHLALSDDVSSISGRYFDEHQAVQPASSLANEVRLQEALWAASEHWTCSAIE